MTRLGGPVALLLVAVLGAGCADQQEQYCGAVEDHQEQLGELLAGGGDAALLEALAPFRELADEAPTDIEDEWSLVIDRIEALGDALAAADVDPATYDAEQPPAGLDDADEDRDHRRRPRPRRRGDPARARRSGAAGARRLPDAVGALTPIAVARRF